MIDNIIAFIKVVDNGSFRKAAADLNLQHSTVIRRIAQLEYALKVSLLETSDKNIKITPEGVLLYEKFKHVNEYASRVLQLFNAKPKSDLKDEISLCLATVLSYEMLCPYIGQFIEKFPNIKVNLSFHFGKIQSVASIEEVERANVYVKKIIAASDLIFTTYSDVNLTTHDCRFIRREIVKLYCRPEYVELYGIPKKIEDLEEHIFIGGLDHFTSNKFDYIKFTNQFTDEEIMIDNSKAKIRTNSALHMKKIGLNSNYIFGCWESLCKVEVASGDLIEVLPDWSAHTIEFFLMSRKQLRPIEQEFINFIYEHLGYRI